MGALILSGDGKSKTCVAGSEQAAQIRKETERFRNDDPVNRMYTHGLLGSAWRRFSGAMKRSNPLCCKLVRDGNENLVQCSQPSVICHHIVSPRQNPDLFLVPSNIRMICRNHHPNTEGDNWTVGVDCVETVVPKWHIAK